MRQAFQQRAAQRRFILIIVLVLVLTSVSAVDAQEADKREVKVDVSGQKAVIESESQIAHRGDELVIEFDNGSHNFLLKYESEDAGAELESEIKAELFDLIEWRDANGNGRYDPEIQAEQVQKIGLGDLVPQSLMQEGISVEGKEGIKITGVTANPAKYPGFSLTLTLHAFGEFLKMEGTSIEPTAIKFDILIDDFPFKEQGTSLALYSKVEIKAEEEVSGSADQGEEALAARAGQYLAFFSWGTKVTVDGRQETLQEAVVKQESAGESSDAKITRELYLLYPRGASILHDPKLGVRQVGKGSTGFGCGM